MLWAKEASALKGLLTLIFIEIKTNKCGLLFEGWLKTYLHTEHCQVCQHVQVLDFGNFVLANIQAVQIDKSVKILQQLKYVKICKYVIKVSKKYVNMKRYSSK